MKEYKNRSLIQLHNADCLEALKGMKDNEFDLAIVDPPYGTTKGMKGIRGKKGGINNIPRNSRRADNAHLYDTNTAYENVKPSDQYFKELQRVSKNQVIWGGAYFPILWKEPSRGFIFWDKQQMSRLHADGEMAWTSFDRNAKCFSYCWTGARGGNTLKSKLCQAIHPTQKPLALYTWTLENYAKTGDRILDTHLGGGAIAVACDLLGFDLVAYEISPVYYQRACERLEDHQSQLTLF